METNRRTDGGDCITPLANAVGNQATASWPLLHTELLSVDELSENVVVLQQRVFDAVTPVDHLHTSAH